MYTLSTLSRELLRATRPRVLFLSHFFFLSIKKDWQTLETLESVIKVPRRVADVRAIVILSDLKSPADDDFMEMRKVFNGSTSDLSI